MKKEESASIQKKTTIKSGDTMEVKKIPDLPIIEPTLYRKDEYFTPTATSAPIVSSLHAQLRKDLWSEDPSGLASFLHRAKGKSSNIIEHYITNPGDISLLPWEEALQIIDKFGTNTAKLHLLFAAHTMRQEKPWESKFTLSANDIISELGWDKRTDLKNTQKLKEISKLAFALGCLTIQATWVEGRGNNKVSCSVQTSRIWETYIDVRSGQLNLEQKIDEPTDVYITVRPGLWTDAFLNRAGCEAKKALYQFGYLAQDILKIDPYHDDLALRLGLHLTVESRFHISGTYKVQTLLEALLPKTVINEALDNRDKARKLTNRWNHALKVLSELKRAFQIEFCPTSYPKELRPNSKARKPRGYFSQLLAAKITIHPPAPIPELLGANTKPQQIQAKLNSVKKIVKESTARAIPLTGTQIKNARKAKGWSQAKLAGLLGVSQRYISMFERGDRTPNSKQFCKIKKILDIH
ncbi:MAG: helix-turn-helix transcriptional regulator [Xenococcaceae cyanobacterium MO_188.B19]|nr:helix-turn-helix transcriptional regulator [Xenococcaceae cyanobacterium MO_188.B19]